jgi:hypothetical protein
MSLILLLSKHLLSPQIVNPQILGRIPLLQIRKFVRCGSPQIANPQINDKSANTQIFTKYCAALSQNNPKGRLF